MESRHNPNNINFGKVMLKCGMKYECTKRQGDLNNQGVVILQSMTFLQENITVSLNKNA